VVNGVIAVPIMAGMMLAGSKRSVMGRFELPRGMKLMGWLATLVMAAAVAAMFVEMAMGGVG
jgi:Mn2+/Fe2+ NRAMP family transporter